MRARFRSAFSALLLVTWVHPDALAAEPRQSAAPRTTIQWASGYGQGIDTSRNVRKMETRWGVDHRVLIPLSLGVEFALLRVLGTRDQRAVDGIGATLMPVVAWHFWRDHNASLALDLGLGAALLYPAFPGGSALQGYSAVGLQARLPLRRDITLLLGARALHHSNGRRPVADNPAFDGLAFTLGAGFGIGRGI